MRRTSHLLRDTQEGRDVWSFRQKALLLMLQRIVCLGRSTTVYQPRILIINEFYDYYPQASLCSRHDT